MKFKNYIFYFKVLKYFVSFLKKILELIKLENKSFSFFVCFQKNIIRGNLFIIFKTNF